ncbi:ATP-binding protein [Desertifilum sp. FACHB-1129]|uniref:KAP family P-loop domain-containing protein n=2 Tax=Desertifilum tharense IPPAS B-1220 TaxID=1781255 RepID=A0A1E5QR14_9CYAN|nr:MULTISPECIES: hypothetical protein [Desertifilum]MDA0210768.1 ATP-binding protein [Cyanobacteria bacterium FC1]MBD2312254.1 ATP-binding protein [Desertifilum sp. FACHB-1129]MBD2323679.1 ATP-binding protein [Desertifilum sp. FACHB-866]MBD2332376.1 ATP-binding protein [Desertifilum sp. FACHB-868]OEJ77125.1 hypothetical protein BH720_01135 [Desertifilum tharense IPPAS B-1220]
MPSIDQLILESINPFDNRSSDNFWLPQTGQAPLVESIHQEAIAQVEETLTLLGKKQKSQTLLLQGDGGSGKTYLLGRLKQQLNHKAYFVYIPPFPESARIWQHILRYTVDSMVKTPEGRQESQLRLWLKEVAAVTQKSLKERVFKENFWEAFQSDRKNFIKYLKQYYQKASIHNPDYFFGILYNLINSDPELQELACQWLRGDDLSDESLKLLGIKNAISTETDACETLFNFSRIATETFPIVLCFDQVQSCARLPDGRLDLPTLMGSISKIHDETYNFLVLLSVSSNSWKENQYTIDVCHIDRIDSYVNLKPIKTPQIEALLAARLGSLHHQAKPKPSSPIYPITAKMLEDEFPRGKTTTREALAFGRDIIQSYKKWVFQGKKGEFIPDLINSPERTEILAKFKNEWDEKLKQTQTTVKRIQRFSSPELIQMLKEALEGLGVTNVKTQLLNNKTFGSHSLSFIHPNTNQKIGIVWTENLNMTSFCAAIKACSKGLENQLCNTLYLLREAELPKKTTAGYKIYNQLFNGKPHRHIQPHLAEVHYLFTYYELTKEAREGDFTISGKVHTIKDLRELIREITIFNQCPLFVGLNLVKETGEPEKLIEKLKQSAWNCIVDQLYTSQSTLVTQVLSKFNEPGANQEKIEQAIAELEKEKKIDILATGNQDKLIAWVPNND